jgi:hypothetical protein
MADHQQTGVADAGVRVVNSEVNEKWRLKSLKFFNLLNFKPIK